MSHSVVPFERKSKVSIGPGYHGQPVSVCSKDSDRPGSNPVRHKSLKEYVLIQGIICLLEVKENLEEDTLPSGPNMLKQLGIKSSGPRPAA